MNNIDNIIAKFSNFKLAAGSHESPDGLGNVCVNEAAIVAAGFEYRAVQSADDCPPCFSRVIAAYAIGLNDKMPDDIRNALLMPFVLRLAGTADTSDVERRRLEFIVVETVRRILPPVLRAARLESHAQACEQVRTLTEARHAANAANAAAYANANAAYAHANAVAAAYAYAAVNANAAAAHAAAHAAAYAHAAYAHAAYANANAAAYADAWPIAVQILDEAIRLGKHNDTSLEVAVGRLEAAKAQEPA